MLGIALISLLATIVVGFIGSRVGAGIGRSLRKIYVSFIKSFFLYFLITKSSYN